jgi:amino acid permease
MSLATQIIWLFVLAIPVASVAWTVTHEEIFREPRQYCEEKSNSSRSYFRRKFFYVPTCEYCFSHYVTIVLLLITRYKLLFDDWRGYLIAFFALPYVANAYMGLYAQTKLEAKKDRFSAKVVQHEAEIKKIEKEEKLTEREEKQRQTPAA